MDSQSSMSQSNPAVSVPTCLQLRSDAEPGFPPELLSKYEPVRLLSEGAFSTVWRARETGTGRLVAIKILSLHLLGNPEAVARFCHEAQLACSIVHPAVVKALDHGITGTAGYIALPLIDGCTLRDKIAQGPMPLWQALLVAIRLTDALAEVHRRGIIHRDLKPENVLLAGHRLPMLTDFGLAKSAQSRARTLEGVILGTPAYIAPEQLEREESTVASDQYSLGLILYEMLTGRRPFEGATPLEEAIARLSGEAVPIHSVLPKLDKRVAGLVMKMLARTPDLRFKSMRAVHRELQLAAQRLQSEGRRSTDRAVASSDPLPMNSSLRRHPGAGRASQAHRAHAVGSFGRAVRSVKFAALKTVRSRAVAPLGSTLGRTRGLRIAGGLLALAAIGAWLCW